MSNEYRYAYCRFKTKKQTSQSYWLIGQPDIEIIEKSGKYSVMVKGFDYYDPITKKMSRKV